MNTWTHVATWPWISMSQQFIHSNTQSKGVGRLVPINLIATYNQVWSHIWKCTTKRLVICSSRYIEIYQLIKLTLMPHDITWLDVSVINWRILLLLHIFQCSKYLDSHLIYLINRQTKVTPGIILKVFSFKKLHQGIEQSLLSSINIFKFNDIRMMKRFQCLKLVNSIIHRCITLKYLDGKILLLHIMPYLEHTSKSTSTKNFMKGHRRSYLNSWLHVFQICYLGLACGISC